MGNDSAVVIILGGLYYRRIGMGCVAELSNVDVVSSKLEAFDEALRWHPFLEIEGDFEEGGEHFIKVLNNETEVAFSLSVRALLEQDLSNVVKTLESGVSTRLFGVTRIVGYYSRISNWNKSKLAELADRHRGSYKLKDAEVAGLL